MCDFSNIYFVCIKSSRIKNNSVKCHMKKSRMDASLIYRKENKRHVGKSGDRNKLI